MAKASDSLSLIGSLVPPGVIMPFGGATAPSGWLLCDGSAVSRTTYAALAAALYDSGTSKYAWGYGDNSTTFNLPDLRGRFMRGRANGSTNDPDRATRAVCNTGGNDADNVGSVQVEATKKNGLSASVSGLDGTHTHGDSGHTHSTPLSNLFRTAPSGSTHNLPASSYVGSGGQVNGNSDTTASSVSTNFASINTTGSNHGHTITVGTGDNETRPINANVNYIIKI